MGHYQLNRDAIIKATGLSLEELEERYPTTSEPAAAHHAAQLAVEFNIPFRELLRYTV